MWPRLTRQRTPDIVENRREIAKAVRGAAKKWGRKLKPLPAVWFEPPPKPKIIPAYRRHRSTWSEEEREAERQKVRERNRRYKMWRRHDAAVEAALKAGLEVWGFDGGKRYKLCTANETAAYHIEQKARLEKLWARRKRDAELAEKQHRLADKIRVAEKAGRLKAIFDSFSPAERALDAELRRRMRNGQ